MELVHGENGQYALTIPGSKARRQNCGVVIGPWRKSSRRFANSLVFRTQRRRFSQSLVGSFGEMAVSDIGDAGRNAGFKQRSMFIKGRLDNRSRICTPKLVDQPASTAVAIHTINRNGADKRRRVFPSRFWRARLS